MIIRPEDRRNVRWFHLPELIETRDLQHFVATGEEHPEAAFEGCRLHRERGSPLNQKIFHNRMQDRFEIYMTARHVNSQDAVRLRGQ